MAILKESARREGGRPGAQTRSGRTLEGVLEGSPRRACEVIVQPRSTPRYRGRQRSKDAALAAELRRISAEHPRAGYRMAAARLRRAGMEINDYQRSCETDPVTVVEILLTPATGKRLKLRSTKRSDLQKQLEPGPTTPPAWLDLDCRFDRWRGAMLNPDQFMDIALLHKEGHSLREIAKLTGHSRNTIRRVIREKVPRAFRTPSRPSRLDPFKEYLRGRFLEHGLSAVRLFAEVRAMGFAGSEIIVRRFLQTLRAEHRRCEADRALRNAAGRTGPVRLGRGRPLSPARRHRDQGLRVRHDACAYSRYLYIEFTRSMALATFDPLSSKRLRVLRRLAQASSTTTCARSSSAPIGPTPVSSTLAGIMASRPNATGLTGRGPRARSSASSAMCGQLPQRPDFHRPGRSQRPGPPLARHRGQRAASTRTTVSAPVRPVARGNADPRSLISTATRSAAPTTTTARSMPKRWCASITAFIPCRRVSSAPGQHRCRRVVHHHPRQGSDCRRASPRHRRRSARRSARARQGALGAIAAPAGRAATAGLPCHLQRRRPGSPARPLRGGRHDEPQLRTTRRSMAWSRSAPTLPAASSTRSPSRPPPRAGPTPTSSGASSSRRWPPAASASSTPACTSPACRG